MQIIKNTLIENKDMGRLVIEDEYYLIKFIYVGNYAEDIKTGLDATYLSAIIKIKKELLPLQILFREKEIAIKGDVLYILENDIDKRIEKMQKIKQEMIEIRKILEEYFFRYYEADYYE